MSYNLIPKHETYSWTGLAFGGGTLTRVIPGMKGFYGRVTKVVAVATVSFVGTTTPAKVQVGDGTTAGKYADMSVGAAGAGTAAGSYAQAQTNAQGLKAAPDSATPHQLIQPNADTTVTFLAATGGSPAGTADVFVTIEWFPC